MRRFAWPLVLGVLLAGLVAAAPLSKREVKKLRAEATQAFKLAKTAEAAARKLRKARSVRKALDQESRADSEYGRLEGLLDKLCEADDKKTWSFIAKIADQTPRKYGLSRVLARACQTMKARAVKKEIVKTALGFKSADVRQVLVKYLGTRDEWDVLIAALEDESEAVAAEAVWGLIEYRAKEGVLPMIERLEALEADRSGIWDVIYTGLARLLGKRCKDAKGFRARWQEVQDSGGLGSVPVAPLGAGPPLVDGGVQLFGRAIDCTRVVFVLDVSGSMDQVDAKGGVRRLERAQDQLFNVLRELPASFKVNLIAYSSRVKVWRPDEGDVPAGLHSLTAENRKSACEFVDSFKADGVTATDSALLRAFEIEGVRCVYLLSDGFATHDGKTPIPADEIVALVEGFKERRITIHTLGFKGADREMMKKVAEASGGVYTDIK